MDEEIIAKIAPPSPNTTPSRTSPAAPQKQTFGCFFCRRSRKIQEHGMRYHQGALCCQACFDKLNPAK